MLDRTDGLPPPQRNAIDVAFGLRDGPAPDRFLVGLAVLGMLAAASADGPLLCVIDDAHWLDRVVAADVELVARRLLPSRGAGVRLPRSVIELAGLEQLEIRGLSEVHSRDLLASAVFGRLDARVRDRIISEARAAIPWRSWSYRAIWVWRGWPGGYFRPDARPVPHQLEAHFGRRFRALPADAREVGGDPRRPNRSEIRRW